MPTLPFLIAAGLCSIGSLAAQGVKRLLDFDDAATAPKWSSVDDGVMGGLSKGMAEIKHGSLHFRGDLSLENDGGFSSIRTARDHDFSGKETVVMRVKGDGRSYELRLGTDARHRGSEVSYGAAFATEKDRWIEVRIPLKSLTPSWRGEKLKGPDFDASEVEEIGILIGDMKAGRFSLEIDWITVE